jgi:ABC-type multidrug transport system fused ATPase/permease subunit
MEATGPERSPWKSSIAWLLGLARPYWRSLLVVLAALCVSSAVMLLLPALAGRVVDVALHERDLASLRSAVLGLFALLLVSTAAGYAHGYLLRATAARVVRDLRERLHAHFLALDAAFHDEQRLGDLLSRLANDVSAVRDASTTTLVGGIQQGIVLVGALAIVLAREPRLTLVMLCVVPPVVIASVMFGARLEKLGEEIQARTADLEVTGEESLSGIRTVKAFGRETFERERFGERSEALLSVALRASRTWSAFNALVYLAGFTGLLAVLWYGATLVVAGSITAGGLTAFLLYTVTIAVAVGSLTASFGALKSAAGATSRIRAIFALRSRIAEPVEPVKLARIRGAVRFDRVQFAYPTRPRERALDGFDLAIEAGRVTALVGRSGAGKSTVVALLLRLHDPSEGRVEIDGVDVRNLASADLRAAIGLVPQDIFLFGGSIADNIRYGRIDARDEEVHAAARAAHAAEFVERLPDGYATLVGQRGVQLSAGERQRIAIARVLLQDPPIVVLDEATSALDAESEHLVQQALDRLLAGRTTLVIAHRLSTVRRAHRVVLMEQGRAAASGTHAEMHATNATYRRLVELQMVEPRA